MSLIISDKDDPLVLKLVFDLLTLINCVNDSFLVRKKNANKNFDEVKKTYRFVS